MPAEPDLEFPPTPELDKQSAVINSAEYQTVEAFLDWLTEDQELLLIKNESRLDYQGLIPEVRSRYELAAEYFGFDLKAAHRERDSILTTIRNARRERDEHLDVVVSEVQEWTGTGW